MTATMMMPFVAHASEGACNSGDALSLGEIEISPTGDPGATFYLDDRNAVLGNGLWTYQESNGDFTGGNAAVDLQRGGSSPYVPSTPVTNETEVCVDTHDEAPDTLIM
ncbi:MAG: hypothetical protein WDA16_00910 [Candidatus Thermoplasmatota archaeon]